MGKTRQLFTVCAVLFGVFTAYAQMIVKGTVVDEMGDPIPEAEVYVKGFEGTGTTTDLDGNYELTVTAGQAANGDVTIVSSFVGTEKEDTLRYVEGSNQNLAIDFGSTEIGPVTVVAQIGYGTVAEENLTSAVDLVTEEDFNKGPIVSAEQLIQGKSTGVNITDAGGAPGSAQTIRIRGYVSLSGSNDPLIVIDGVPLETSVGGNRNVLSLINPNDIETFSVLKDASAAAIYGSRGSGGVIIITTKKGSKKDGVKFNLSSKVSISDPYKTVDVMNGDQFREIAIQQGNTIYGNANTDWQDQIYREAIMFDHNLSAVGRFKGVPFRASIGYTDQDGILKGDNMKRTTGSLVVSPSFFDNHLKIELNGKGSYIENDFANTGAIGSAVSFDPSQPVYDSSTPSGFFSWTNSLAPDNPLALLKYTDDPSESKRFIGNAKVDYKFHFLPDLTFTANVGYDYFTSEGGKTVNKLAQGSKPDQFGERNIYDEKNTNQLIDLYFTYDKKLESINSELTAVAGYSYQEKEVDNYNGFYNLNLTPTDDNYFLDNDTRNRNTLLSYFGRVNYAYAKKYLLDLSFRYDGSSKLNPDDQWDFFPSISAAWRISKEDFMADSKVISDLKLRAGWGQTGNQGGIDNYSYLPNYTASQNDALYMIGNDYYITYRPDVYNPNLKWERTSSFNVGVDYGFFNDRISGSLDVYHKKTTDLLTYIDLPAGALSNGIVANVGDMENQGIEFSMSSDIIRKENLNWNFGFNISYNDNEVTDLASPFIESAGIPGATGNPVKGHVQGERADSYFVYEQVYDDNGRPIEGVYVDQNGDGEINFDDRYVYKNSIPDIFLGFNTNFNYKNWDLSASARANINKYNYNHIEASRVPVNNVLLNQYNTNFASSYYDTQFTEARYNSDYYIQNADFFRLDNITVGYTLPEDMLKGIDMRLYGSVQNVAVITDYKGLDPEVQGGIDNDFYPRPRTFLFGLNINF